MTEADEHELLTRAVGGDGEAFTALVEEYYAMIYGTAYKWLGNREDAEDVAQEACVKLARAIRGFRMEAKFSTWVYRIVLNAAKDFRRARPAQSSMDDVPELAAMRTSDACPEERAERNRLWDLVRRLPAKQRDAVLLVYAEDLSHGEAAGVMACAETTVSWYIHEAKKRLKAWMDGHDR